MENFFKNLFKSKEEKTENHEELETGELKKHDDAMESVEEGEGKKETEVEKE